MVKLYHITHLHFHTRARTRGVLSDLVHIWKAFLSHIIPRLILIRDGRNYKDSKALPHNTHLFLMLELEVS